jgi:hypothetical protein
MRLGLGVTSSVRVLLVLAVSTLAISAAPRAAVAAVRWGSPMLVDPQPAVGSGTFIDVSCASASLCVAADQFGNVVTSTDPTGGASSWKVTPIVPGSRPLSIWGLACPSSLLCVAGSAAGPFGVFSSTNPAHGGPTWSPQTPVQANAVDISCPSAKLCVGVGGPDVMSSSDPSSSTRPWRSTNIDDAM